jgi:hypothetical protein
MRLLIAKPFLYVFNLADSELGDEELRTRLSELVTRWRRSSWTPRSMRSL